MPEPAIYDYAMKKFKITDATTILFIDDSIANILAARKKVGMRFIFKNFPDLAQELRYFAIHLTPDSK